MERMAVLMVALAVGGCGPSRLPYVGPDWDSAAHTQAAFDMYDANGDGQLDRQELAKCPGLFFGLEVLDTSRDGAVSQIELRNQLESFRSIRDQLLPIVAQASMDGRPLPGATVTATPDPFAAEILPPASGVTDASGKAVFQIEGKDKPGIYAGVYRLSITKQGAGGAESLPARYNTQSTLGLLVSPDANAAVAFPRYSLSGK